MVNVLQTKNSAANLKAFIMIQLKTQSGDKLDRFVDHLAEYAPTQSYTMLHGEYDFMISYEGQSLSALDDFRRCILADYPDVQNTRTHIAI